MGADKSWESIGEEIRGAVEDALQTGNFREFGDAVTVSVKDMTAKVGQAVSEGLGGTNRTEQMAQATRERRRMQEERAKEQAAAQAARRVPFVNVGRVSGVLLRIFGWILAVPMGISVLVLFIELFGQERDVSSFLICLMFFLASAGMIYAGRGKRQRLRRARKYVELAGNNHYSNLDELARFSNRSEEFVRKDVKKMLAVGIFPEGHLDVQESCLMLDNKIYGEYLKLEKQKRAYEQEKLSASAKESGAASPNEAVQTQQEKTDSGLDAMIAEGQECIRKLRNMNDNIPGEEISAKLFRLENLLKEIFEGLKAHPEQMPQMKKFMNYYLPTTLKLVEAYEKFDNMSAQGEDILEAKAEIEKTLDTINAAFEELLGRMLRDTAFDVTTDAQVLKTMLEKEGLTRQNVFVKR